MRQLPEKVAGESHWQPTSIAVEKWVYLPVKQVPTLSGCGPNNRHNSASAGAFVYLVLRINSK